MPQSRAKGRYQRVTARGRTAVTPADQSRRVFTAFCRPSILVNALVVCALAAACSKPTSRVDADVQQSATPTLARAECMGAWLGPSAIPPDQGMWTEQESPDTNRVVAMIGPAEVRAGSTVVTRTIETIEAVGQTQSIRSRADAAVMHVEVLPRYVADRIGAGSRALRDRPTEPAAAYTLTPLVSVVSYESCAGPPAVRYLRRDARGAIARDEMLRRVSDVK